ncbi:MAG: leucine--tRNA ligase [Candidatus Nealsonbacteria bacterium]|nr:leucine--tRNA ligase [Candidatus Nealsonbacteria bacterium]
MRYNPQLIEKKWQRIWEKTGIYKTKDRVKGKKNFFCLDMFPYPSGHGLHVGHLHGYVGSDVVSRYYRMRGFNVLHPMGFDAFGLPAENAAIKFGIHPKVWTYKNIKDITKQLKSLGAMYDWKRLIITSEPDYYKWTQWLFLQLYKSGLAYRQNVPANWCKNCKTILANEQVVDGKCERCDSRVFQKNIEQWMFKITSYGEDLLSGLGNLDWPENTKTMQRNWIGRSEGWEIRFKIQNSDLKTTSQNSKFIEVFTTRADTLFGATYLVLSPEHPIIKNLKSQIANLKFVEEYIEETKKKTERERISEAKEKTGVELQGIKAVNPANGREIPVFVADYVLGGYGKGAIMAVPAHDQRDSDFSKRHNLPIIKVIKAGRERFSAERAYEGEGILVNSGEFDGMDSIKARDRIGKWLSEKGLAKKSVYYKLRDWTISRQRYWGAPIPMIYCKKCGWQTVPEEDLPVLLPPLKDFKPTEDGKSPLARVNKFVETACPKCRGRAKRETDTMDTFVCSSWYYFRFTDPKNKKQFASKEKIKIWLPVDIYIGGAEHTVGHLLYSRFFTRFLKNKKYLSFSEPFLRLSHPGIILGPDNQKMSKSKGNVITPESVTKKYGMDTLRVYEMFMGPFGDSMPWSTEGIEGSYRFLKKLQRLNSKLKSQNSKPPASPKLQRGEQFKSQKLEKLLHQTIKKVSDDIKNFRFNTAISALMILVNELQKEKQLTVNNYQLLLKLLAPFAPHLAEELWLPYGKSVHLQPWPKYDPKLVREKETTLVLQVNGKVRDKIGVEIGISEEKAKKLAISSQKIRKWIEGKKVIKIVFVPNKLINIVI